MDAFIKKLKEYGLALRCTVTNNDDLSETPVFDEQLSAVDYLFHLTNHDYNIYVLEHEPFINKFDLQKLFGERPSFFTEFFYLEFDVLTREISIGTDTTFSFTDDIIKDFVNRNIELYEEPLKKHRIKSMFAGGNPIDKLTEEILKEIVLTSSSDLLKSYLLTMQKELHTSLSEVLSERNKQPI